VFGGCSMGGYVAMAVLRAAPSRVSGLVLISTKASADTPEAKQNRYAMADRVEQEGVTWIPATMRSVLLGDTTLRDRPTVEATVSSLITSQSSAAVAWAQRAMAARPDSFDVLRGAEVPALIVRGTEDALIPGEEAVEMAAALGESELVELPGVGHLAPLESPEDIAATVTHWLGPA
jgi:pimeloyl-ACP methyl ester carboxylesterase